LSHLFGQGRDLRQTEGQADGRPKQERDCGLLYSITLFCPFIYRKLKRLARCMLHIASAVAAIAITDSVFLLVYTGMCIHQTQREKSQRELANG